MGTTRRWIAGAGLKLAGPVVMVAALLADHWLPAGQPNTSNLHLVLLGLVALIAGVAGLMSAVVSGGILLAADAYALRLAAGPGSLPTDSWVYLLSTLLALILIVFPVGLRNPAENRTSGPASPREENHASVHRVDVVTGLLARHHLMSMAQIEWDRWRRFATPFSLLLVEVDGLDALRRSDPNNADALLRVLANRMTSSLRTMDVASRIDDNRFLILLPQTSESGSLVAAKKVLKVLELTRVENNGGDRIADLRMAAAGVHRSDDHLQNVVQRVKEAVRRARQPGFEGVALIEPEVAGPRISTQ